MNEKACTQCGLIKPISDFYINKGGKRPGLVASECKVCKRRYGKRHYHNDAGRKARVLKWSSLRYEEIKTQVFDYYGNKCACCGESEPMFLTIDHIDNDGAQHRKIMARNCKTENAYRFQGGKKTYYWLIKNGFPAGFQVLCSNCNHGKHRNGGVCPHVTKASEGSTTIPKGSTQQAIGCGSAEPLL